MILTQAYHSLQTHYKAATAKRPLSTAEQRCANSLSAFSDVQVHLATLTSHAQIVVNLHLRTLQNCVARYFFLEKANEAF